MFLSTPVSHKSSFKLLQELFPHNFDHYLEIIEASLLYYMQAKTFADNHRCVFHFSEFNSSDFLVKTFEKSELYGRKQA